MRCAAADPYIGDIMTLSVRTAYRALCGVALSLFVAAASDAAAQARPYTWENIVEIVGRPGITTEVILAEMRQECVNFLIDDQVATYLRAKGADEALIQGLRARVCHSDREARVQPSRRVRDAERGEDGLFLTGYGSIAVANHELDSTAGAGGGAGTEVGVSFRGIGVFLTASYAATGDGDTPDFRSEILGGGVRVYFPYGRTGWHLAAGLARFFVEYDDPEAESSPGTGFLFGGGVQYFVTPSLALDVGTRGVVGTYDGVVENTPAGWLTGEKRVLIEHVTLGIAWYP